MRIVVLYSFHHNLLYKLRKYVHIFVFCHKVLLDSFILIFFRRGDGGRFSMRSTNNNSSLSRVANSNKTLMDPSILKPRFRTGGGNINGFAARAGSHKVRAIDITQLCIN